MKKLLCILLMVVALVGVTGCGKNEEVKEEQKLDELTQLVSDRTIKLFDEFDFFNPSQVRVLKAILYYFDWKNCIGKSEDECHVEHTRENLEQIYVKIQGTNKAGGTITQCYKVYDNTIENAKSDSAFSLLNVYELDKHNTCDTYGDSNNSPRYDTLETHNIKQINELLKEHWEALGID